MDKNQATKDLFDFLLERGVDIFDPSITQACRVLVEAMSNEEGLSTPENPVKSSEPTFI